MPAPPSASGPPRPGGVRTTRRRGRTSAAKARVLAEIGPRWSAGATGWDDASLRRDFAASGPLLVDLGVGDGRATLDWAARHPDARVLAVELHRPGLAKLLAALDGGGPPNVRVAEADALAVLAGLDPGRTAAIRLLFPDPWPKRRHVGRRLVDRAFAVRTAEVLAPGGELGIATDWPDYAEHARTTIAAEHRLEPLGRGERPPRPITAYEQRGIDAGRPIADLRYRRRPDGA